MPKSDFICLFASFFGLKLACSSQVTWCAGSQQRWPFGIAGSDYLNYPEEWAN